jgi:hypothetical protein
VDPREHIQDPVTSLVMGLPLDLQFRTKGSWPWISARTATPDGLKFDFACGYEVYGGCTRLREFFEASGQAYVLRVASSFMITLALGTRVTGADAVKRLVKTSGAGKSAPPARAPRASAGTPGPGSPPHRRGTICSSAAT